MNIKKMLPSSIYEFLKERYHNANRKLSPVVCTDIISEPFSRKFGMDRGMPIDRFYIERFLADNASFIHGNLMEIAETKYSNKFGKNGSVNYVLSYDNAGDSTDGNIITGDLTKMETIPEGIIDCFICTQTLNFLYDVKSAIRGINRILRKKGVALVTVSGLSQISQYDYKRWGDYWRFTDLSIGKLFAETFEPEKIKVFSYGNLAASTA